MYSTKRTSSFQYCCSSRNRSKKSKLVSTRPAVIEDVCDLAEIERRCFGLYYTVHRYGVDDFDKCIENEQCFLRVAEYQSNLIGYALGQSYRGKCSHIVHLIGIAVIKDFRRFGLGSDLLRSIFTESKRRHASLLTLEVADKNIYARLFFEQHGFRGYRRVRDYYDKGIDALRMRRYLRR